jgi:hypothetical protein
VNSKRKFLEKAIASGLACETITTDDVVRHADPSVLANNLPVDLKAKLIAACLEAEAMTTGLIVGTIGTEDLAANLPTAVLWGCVVDCAARSLGAAPNDEASAAGPGKQAAAGSKNGEKPVAAVPEIAPSKPNVTARPKSSSSSSKKPARGSRGAGATSKRRAPTASRGGARTPTSPIMPRSEFEVDTDIGEEDWGVDDIVEVVEEAEAVGAEPIDVSDWKNEEETVTRDADGKP